MGRAVARLAAWWAAGLVVVVVVCLAAHALSGVIVG